MLSLGKLAPDQQQYYLDTVARGAEEYYTGAKEAPGQWIGAGSTRLGLKGEVDAEVLGRVLGHVDPSGTHRLTGSRSVPVVAGFDATFCAPKSVSLLFALGDPEVSNAVRNANDAAISASLEVLEDVACRVRRGQGGLEILPGDGFVAAGFRHRTSRAGDPHLHTHVVIANLAHSSADDRWTALDARPVYAWSSPVGHLYEAQLRWELTHRLGVDWEPVRNGIADVAGIPRPVLREFSTRRIEIEAHLAAHGQQGAKAAQAATYATRQAKDPSLDAEGLLPGWRARADSLGFEAAALSAVVDRTRAVDPPGVGGPEAGILYESLASAEGLTARASTFGQRDVIKAVCNALPGGGRVDQILDLVDGFLRSAHVVPVRADARAATIRRADGLTVSARTDEVRFTTPEMLELEAGLVDAALRRRHAGAAITTDRAVEAAIARRQSLSVEQVAMVRAICGSGSGIDLVEGVAGSGKTFALAAARDAWEASGNRVIGCSLAARAAQQLQDDADIPASTIGRLLGRLDRHEAALDNMTVLIVDEAAMVGTRNLVRLLAHAEATDAKVVLVGDPCQLPEIDAGGAFRGLRARLGSSHLTENRRQHHPWERDALAELRDGDPDRAVDALVEHGRVHHAADPDELRGRLVEEWIQARANEDVLMVAARRTDIDDLNRRARAMLRNRGDLGADQVVLGGRGFTEGDEVLARRNNYRLGVLNGTRGIIEQIDTRRHEMVLATSTGERLVVPFEYAANGHLTHGYATTIHKAQGATVDRCLVLLDDTTSREHAYTALSRGRHDNDLFITGEDRRVDERHAAEIEPDPLDALRQAVRRSGAKRMAIDELEQQPPASPLESLRRERDEVERRLGDGPPDRWSEYRRVDMVRQQAKVGREGAQWRLNRARQDLDDLGPIGRRTHRARRRELEGRVAGFESDIARYDQQLADTRLDLRGLGPTVLARQSWEREHRPALDRIDELDHEIRVVEAFDRVASRDLERGLEVEHGLEL